MDQLVPPLQRTNEPEGSLPHLRLDEVWLLGAADVCHMTTQYRSEPHRLGQNNISSHVPVTGSEIDVVAASRSAYRIFVAL